MPSSSGLFDRFENLDQIKVEEIARWLKPTPLITVLEDYIANRILYPKTIPVLSTDTKKDLAILREALRLSVPSQSRENKTDLLESSPFINITMKKIIIPEGFLEFIPDLASLVWAFIDGLLYNLQKDRFGDLWTIILSSEADKIIGSVLLPQFDNLNGFMEIKLEGRKYKIKAGSFTILPCLKYRCPIEYTLSCGSLLGKNTSAIEIYGGEAGLVIDGRIM